MSWQELVKTNAIVASRERTTTDKRIFNRTKPLGWNPHEVWLTRVKQPRDLAAQASVSEPSTPPHQDAPVRV